MEELRADGKSEQEIEEIIHGGEDEEGIRMVLDDVEAKGTKSSVLKEVVG